MPLALRVYAHYEGVVATVLGLSLCPTHTLMEAHAKLDPEIYADVVCQCACLCVGVCVCACALRFAGQVFAARITPNPKIPKPYIIYSPKH